MPHGSTCPTPAAPSEACTTQSECGTHHSRTSLFVNQRHQTYPTAVQVPDITAVTADPNFLSPGQPFGLTVTLAAPGVSFGTLRAGSNPASITCQPAELTGAVTEVTLPCAAPPAPSSSAQAAAALQQDQQRPEAAQQAAAMPAAGEAVDASTQSLPLLNPAATTKSYTITATASADRTDTQATTVTVSLHSLSVCCNGCGQLCVQLQGPTA